MKPRSIAILGVLTAIMVVAAVITAVVQNVPRTMLAEREAAFPALVKQINDVAAIEIASAEGRFTITGGGDSWGIAEKQDYTVPRKKVRDFVLSLANLKLVESKTAQPDRYSRLEVDDVDADEAESRSVVVFDGTGKELARAIIGRRKYFLYVDGRGGTYIRRGGEARSWLAEGEMDFGSLPEEWLDRFVPLVTRDELQEVSITQPTLETLVVRKETPEDEHYTVLDGPVDRELKTTTEADRLGFVVEKFEFGDVVPVEDLSIDGPRHIAQYKTFDGLEVTFDIVTKIVGEAAADEIEEIRWARVSAKVSDDVAEDKREAVTAQAADINARTSPWIYRLEDLDASRVTKKLADLYKEPATQ